MAKKKPTPKSSAPKRAKKPAAAPPAPTKLVDTAELVGDGDNPRRIGEEAAGGLANSLDRFGDLSGIVYNRRTGELVCGHQRMTQIRGKWGDRPIEPIDEAAGLFGIRVDSGHFFSVRVVDWSKAMQRAANVAANNQRIAGEFTDDVANYLLAVEPELSAEAPGLLDDLLLAGLLANAIDNEPAEDAGGAAVGESYQVIVQCVDENHQRQVYEQLQGQGLPCKVLTI